MMELLSGDPTAFFNLESNKWNGTLLFLYNKNEQTTVPLGFHKCTHI